LIFELDLELIFNDNDKFYQLIINFVRIEFTKDLKMRKARELRFNVNEIFYSIQGEGTRAGLPCVFVRLQGCLLRCSWCDTPYALEKKEIVNRMTGEEIFKSILKYECKFLMLTGGEPLEQDDIFDFITLASDKGYEVVIETNGQADVSRVDKRAYKIMDFKCPSSNMSRKNNYGNINYLNLTDEVKFVIGNKIDFDWALDRCREFDLFTKVKTILFSPVFGEIEPVELSNWILEHNYPIRLQLQMHKFIWEPNTRGV
jgi:7-carboxy-7-deazaguanine synthase